MSTVTINNKNVQEYINKQLIDPYSVKIDLNGAKTANDNVHRWITLADAIKGGYKFNFDYDIKDLPSEIKTLPEVTVTAPKKMYSVGAGEMRPFNSAAKAAKYAKEHPKKDASEVDTNYLLLGGLGLSRPLGGILWNGVKEIFPYFSANGWLQSTQAVGNTPAWLTPRVATAIDAGLAGSATGSSIYDWHQNGPSVENVLGTTLGVGGLAFEAAPTVMEGYNAVRNVVKPYALSRVMNSSLKSAQMPPEFQFIRTNFNLGKNSGRVIRADRGNGKGAFTGTGAYIKDGFLYPGKTRAAGQRDFTWWNENELFSPGIRFTKPYQRVFIANKSDIPGLSRVKEMDEPVGQWRPGSKKAFVRKSEMVTAEPIDISNLTQYNYDPFLGYVRSDVSTHNIDLSRVSPQTKYLQLLGNKKESGTFTGSIRDRSLVTRPFADYMESLGIDSSIFTEQDLNTLMKMRSKSVQSSIPEVGRSAVVYETRPRNQLTIFSIDINENGNTLGEISARSDIPNHPRANEVPIDMVQRVEGSPSRGLSEDAYNAAIDYIKQTGIGEGLVSGERLLSPEITYNVWKHYPNRQLLRTNGHHTFGTGRDVVGQPVSETHKGPVVMLTEPSKTPLPMKSNSIFHPDMIKDGKLLPPDWTKYGIYYSLPLLLGTYGMFTNKKAN